MTEILGDLNQGPRQSKYSLLYSIIFDDLERAPIVCSIFKLDARYPSFVFNVHATSSYRCEHNCQTWTRETRAFSATTETILNLWFITATESEMKGLAKATISTKLSVSVYLFPLTYSFITWL